MYASTAKILIKTLQKTYKRGIIQQNFIFCTILHSTLCKLKIKNCLNTVIINLAHVIDLKKSWENNYEKVSVFRDITHVAKPSTVTVYKNLFLD